MGWDGPVTHRQFVIWSRWYRDEYSTPSRSDYYLAQIAAEVRRGLVKNPQSVKLSTFVLDFDDSRRRMPELSPEAQDELSKSKWLAFMASSSDLAVVHKTRAPDEQPYAPIPVETLRHNDPSVPHSPSSASSSSPEKKTKSVRKGR